MPFSLPHCISKNNVEISRKYIYNNGINYKENDEKANEVLNSVLSLGRKAFLYKCDVSEKPAVKEMIDKAVKDIKNVY